MENKKLRDENKKLRLGILASQTLSDDVMDKVMEHLTPSSPPPSSDSGTREKIEAWKRSLKISSQEIAELPPHLGIPLMKFLNINYTD